MTRFWPDGLPIGVVADAEAAPRALTWHRTTHRVERVFNRWRDDQGWWDQRICREYFVLRTHSGLLLMVFRDVLGGGWYLQRIYD
jgi:hypothetical protein